MSFASLLRSQNSRRALRREGAALVLCLIAPLASAAQVTELQIAPSQIQIQPGEQKSILVTAFDAVGNVVTNAEFRWSADNSIVEVMRDQTAPNILYIRGVASGQAVITVRSGGVSGKAEVVVAGADLAGIPVGSGETAVLRIEPETIFLLPTEEAQLRPLLLRADGEPAARTGVTWRSLLETVASVSSTGLVVGISPGQGVIEAQVPNGVVGRALVRVDNAPLAFTERRLTLAPLDSDTLQVVVANQGNRTVANRQLRWGSTDPSVVNVSPLGVVTGIRAGRANVVIQGFGQQHELPVTVHRRVVTMDISPPRGEVTVPIGGSVDFEAVLSAEDGTPVPDAPVMWENGDSSIARFDRGSGRVTGVRQGTTILRATGPAEGLQAEWLVNVVAGGIEVDYDNAILSKGETVPVPVWIRDTAGNRLQPADRVVWFTSDSSVAIVTDTTLHAVGWGSAHVVATTSWGARDSIRAVVQGELLITATRSGNSDIYSLEPNNLGDLNRITHDTGAELDGAYSPDGRHIAYVATGQANRTDLHIVDVDGANPRRVTPSSGDVSSPGWLADGRIVYQLNQNGVAQIWVVDVDGTTPQQLTAGRRSSDQPAVSPDGTRIAFRRDDQIFIMGADGVAAQITEDGRYRNPNWFPDGSLGYIVERRVGRETVRVIVKRDPTSHAETDVTSPQWPVVDWAVAGDGETLALVVQETINEVLTQGMWIVRGTPGSLSEPRQIPRVTELEQFLFPNFRW